MVLYVDIEPRQRVMLPKFTRMFTTPAASEHTPVSTTAEEVSLSSLENSLQCEQHTYSIPSHNRKTGMQTNKPIWCFQQLSWRWDTQAIEDAADPKVLLHTVLEMLQVW